MAFPSPPLSLFLGKLVALRPLSPRALPSAEGALLLPPEAVIVIICR